MDDSIGEDLAINIANNGKPLDHNDTQDYVPDLCKTINRKQTLVKCLDVINRTCTQGSKHKACVCVICDCFIIRTEIFC